MPYDDPLKAADLPKSMQYQQQGSMLHCLLLWSIRAPAALLSCNDCMASCIVSRWHVSVHPAAFDSKSSSTTPSSDVVPIDDHDLLVGLLLAPENQNRRDQRYNEIKTAVEFMIPQNHEEYCVCILQEVCKLLAEVTSHATVRPQ